MNRASGGKSTNQILLFPRLYKSKAPQLPPALLPTSFFLSFTKFVSPRPVLLFYSNKCLHMLNLIFLLFFSENRVDKRLPFRNDCGSATQNIWLWYCKNWPSFMLVQHLDFPFLWEQSIADVLKTWYVHTA